MIISSIYRQLRIVFTALYSFTNRPEKNIHIFSTANVFYNNWPTPNRHQGRMQRLINKKVKVRLKKRSRVIYLKEKRENGVSDRMEVTSVEV